MNRNIMEKDLRWRANNKSAENWNYVYPSITIEGSKTNHDNYVEIPLLAVTYKILLKKPVKQETRKLNPKLGEPRKK